MYFVRGKYIFFWKRFSFDVAIQATGIPTEVNQISVFVVFRIFTVAYFFGVFHMKMRRVLRRISTHFSRSFAGEKKICIKRFSPSESFPIRLAQLTFYILFRNTVVAESRVYLLSHAETAQIKTGKAFGGNYLMKTSKWWIRFSSGRVFRAHTIFAKSSRKFIILSHIR